MIKKLNNRGFSHIESFLLVMVLVVISGVGYYVFKHNKSAHAGSQIVATINTKHKALDDGDFTILACKQNVLDTVSKATTKYNITSSASFANPASIKNGAYGTATSYFIEVNGTVVAGSKDSTDVKTINEAPWDSAGITATPKTIPTIDTLGIKNENPQITFGISISNTFATPKKPLTKNDYTNQLSSAVVKLKAIPNCNEPTSKFAGAKTSLALTNGITIEQGDRLISANNKYMLKMQSDGNLVEYNVKTKNSKWQSGTAGHPHAFARINDGNLEVTNPTIVKNNGTPLWQSNTAGHPGAIITLDEAGYLNIKTAQGLMLWTTKPQPVTAQTAPTLINFKTNKNIDFSVSPNNPYAYVLSSVDNSFVLRLENNGNLVEYGNNQAVWSTQTDGDTGNYTFHMENDGNLSIYGGGGDLVWASQTANQGAASLSLNMYNFLTINDSAGNSIWNNVPHISLNTSQDQSIPPTDPPACNVNFPLFIGSCGANVTNLQNKINSKIKRNLVVDGVFGADTCDAVVSLKVYVNNFEKSIFPKQNGQFDCVVGDVMKGYLGL